VARYRSHRGAISVLVPRPTFGATLPKRRGEKPCSARRKLKKTQRRKGAKRESEKAQGPESAGPRAQGREHKDAKAQRRESAKTQRRKSGIEGEIRISGGRAARARWPERGKTSRHGSWMADVVGRPPDRRYRRYRGSGAPRPIFRDIHTRHRMQPRVIIGRMYKGVVMRAG
jgi:hypothetical protein